MNPECFHWKHQKMPVELQDFLTFWRDQEDMVLYRKTMSFWALVILNGHLNKICYDALNSRDSEAAWCVSNVLFNILECRKSFSSCTFVWISREANEVAHSMAKFASQSRTCFNCNMSFLPKPVWVSWRHDVLCSVS